MANQIIPQRSEVPEEYTWNLKDLYESDQAWNEEYKALKALPEQITAFRGTLGRTAEDLLAWFRLQDQVEERLSRLYGYASCKGDEDTGNSFYQDMRGKAMSTLVTISSAAAFATPEIMEIPEDTLNLFYTAQPELETYRRSLYQIRRRKAHILSPCRGEAAGLRRRDGQRLRERGQRVPQRRYGLSRRGGRGRQCPSADGRHLRPHADEPRPGAAPPCLRDLLQGARPV